MIQRQASLSIARKYPLLPLLRRRRPPRQPRHKVAHRIAHLKEPAIVDLLATNTPFTLLLNPTLVACTFALSHQKSAFMTTPPDSQKIKAVDELIEAERRPE